MCCDESFALLKLDGNSDCDDNDNGGGGYRDDDDGDGGGYKDDGDGRDGGFGGVNAGGYKDDDKSGGGYYNNDDDGNGSGGYKGSALLFLTTILDLVLVFWTKMLISFSQILVTSICDSFSPVLVDKNSKRF